MKPSLELDLFIKSPTPHHGEIFPQNALLLLGSELKSWLRLFLQQLGVKDSPVIHGTVSAQAVIEGPVFIAEGVTVEPFAYIKGPCYIGPGTEVRHGAYIRGGVYVGAGCVVGHTTEVKNSVFFDGAKAGHFAYLGDSILGQNVNLGAGTKLANLKLKQDEVMFMHPQTKQKTPSGLKKFGAILGDNCQTGCNSVLSPGTLLLPGRKVLPCSHTVGTH